MSKLTNQKMLFMKAFGNHFLEWMDWVADDLFPKDVDMEKARIALQQVKRFNQRFNYIMV